jgi:hypothetical protein
MRNEGVSWPWLHKLLAEKLYNMTTSWNKLLFTSVISQFLPDFVSLWFTFTPKVFDSSVLILVL